MPCDRLNEYRCHHCKAAGASQDDVAQREPILRQHQRQGADGDAHGEYGGDDVCGVDREAGRVEPVHNPDRGQDAADGKRPPKSQRQVGVKTAMA